MSARRLDGTAAAAAIRAELAPQVSAFTASAGRQPALAIVLVGEDPASHVYVRNKQRAGEESGLTVTVHRMPATSTVEDVLGKRGIRRANFANRAVQVPNDLDEIVKAIEVYA